VNVKYMECLVPDIQRQILHSYVGASYAPLVSLASRRWQNIAVRQHIVYHCGCIGTPAKRIPKDSAVISLADLARDGNARLLQWIRSKGSRRWQRLCTAHHCVRAAARYGHEDIVDQCTNGSLFSLSAENHDLKLVLTRAAARGGHDNLLRHFQFHEWNITYEYHAVSWAARGGHLHTLLFLCNAIWSRRSDHHRRQMVSFALERAARGGHKDVMEWLYNLGLGRPMGPFPEEICADTIMACAAEGGHEHIVRLAHDVLGATNVGRTMTTAAQRGHEHIVRLCKEEYHVTNVNVEFAMVEAAKNGHIEIVRLCKQYYSDVNVSAVMCAAASGGHTEVVRLCYEQWACTDVFLAMEAAANSMVEQYCWHDGRADVIRQCLHWIDTTLP